MARFLGFGDGSDGLLTVSSPTTATMIDSSCSGTSGASSLTATNASFAAGQIVVIHQSRGAGVGAYEFNQIASYVAGTITLVHPLENTYTDSGASQAQVVVAKQYSGVTISDTYTGKAWTGDVGGILPILCNGVVNVTGTLSVKGADGIEVTSTSYTGGGAGVGYRGGDTKTTSANYTAYQGEGTSGAGTTATTANGTGGGGGQVVDGTYGGGGGGYATAGANGQSDPSGGAVGAGGGTVGQATLTSLYFGGGGGGGVRDVENDSGSGAGGGGILILAASKITGTGTITANGGDGGDAGAGGGGGAGAGGSILIKTVNSDLSSLTVTASGGTGGDSLEKGGTGGNGGNGRIRVEACVISGTTTPTASESEGGYSYCGGAAFIF